MSFEIRIPHPDITDQPRTTLSAAAAAAATSLTVPNSNGFNSDKYVAVGTLGASNAEIKKLGTVSSVSALPIAALSFAHVSGEVVQHIPYNQIELTYSTDFEGLWNSGLYSTLADAASAATWSALTTINIQPSQNVTVYEDQTASRSYRYRYKNSQDTIYSDYMNYFLPSGYENRQVAAIIRKATDRLNKEVKDVDGAPVTYQFCYDAINDCLEWYEIERSRWAHNQSFETTIAEITAGTNGYVLPSNVAFRNTNQSEWNLRIDDNYNLRYIDKREWDVLTQGWHTSLLGGSLTSGSSTITFDDTSNFADDGSFDVWTSGTKDTVRYSANNRTTNTLTLTDASTDVTTTHAADTPVWQGASYGVPNYFTVFGGKIYFDLVPNDSIHQHAISGDLYLKTQQVNSLDDYVRSEYPIIFVEYLKACIADTSNQELKYDKYMANAAQLLRKALRREYSGQRQYLRPRHTLFNRHNYSRVRYNTDS